VKSGGISPGTAAIPAGPLEPQRHADGHPRLFQRLRFLLFWPSDTLALGRLKHAMAAADRNRHQALEGYTQATRAAPTAISSTPNQALRSSCSPRNTSASKAISTTLSLSSAATPATGPSCRARL
jgi:hypothetical protein